MLTHACNQGHMMMMLHRFLRQTFLYDEPHFNFIQLAKSACSNLVCIMLRLLQFIVTVQERPSPISQ